MLITPELATYIAQLSREIKRQIGILIDRRGNIEYVIVGNNQRIWIPELEHMRMGIGRLLGLRMIHTHLRGEPLTRDDLTDLALLRLDFISAIEVLPDGSAGHLRSAYLLPDNDNNKSWELMESPSPKSLELDFQQHIRALEDEFARTVVSRSVDGRRERAVLVGVYPSSGPRSKESMDELKALVRSSGLNVIEEVIQVRPKVDPLFVLGRGKVEELIIRSKQVGADVIIFDRDLTPVQLRTMSELSDQKIIDRTQLILDIFAQHALSRDGKMQVELAQLRYLLPRLVGRYPALSRLRGGIGLRGPGETKLEIDRRRVRDRIVRLEKAIDNLSRNRSRQRAKRKRQGLPIISIIGYTNTGKSTLLNALTNSNVRVEDKLFATLDPSSRRLRFPRERDVIITDTVGFIRNLPPDLIKAFRSTLEELEDADLLLHVADLSNPNHDRHIEAANSVLEEIGLNRRPQLYVFNKMDLVSRPEAQRIAARYGGVAVSAKTKEGFDSLLERIEEMVFSAPQGLEYLKR